MQIFPVFVVSHDNFIISHLLPGIKLGWMGNTLENLSNDYTITRKLQLLPSCPKEIPTSAKTFTANFITAVMSNILLEIKQKYF